VFAVFGRFDWFDWFVVPAEAVATAALSDRARLVDVDLERSATLLLDASRDAALTYPEVGATTGPRLPRGYRHVRRRAVVGHGTEAFRLAAEAVVSWRMHRGAGLRVFATTSVAEPGTAVVMAVALPPLRVLAPCRVVYSVDDAHGRGFVYGTLPGHPEVGEEAFLVRQEQDGSVVLDITAFSRPGTWYSRLAGPLTPLAQELITRRYVHAVRREVS